jgi:serine/threonine-protein kinase
MGGEQNNDVDPGDVTAASDAPHPTTTGGAGLGTLTGPSTPPPFADQRYAIVGFIGRGGMGEVHRAFDRVLNRTVALKVVRAEYAGQLELNARFLEEAQIAAQLDHPGIVPVYDHGRFPDGRLWLTMKEVRGRTYGALIAEHHRGAEGVTLQRLMQIYLRVCEAVAAAHARRVVHRDLKPENVMVGDFGEVFVMDWGLAKVVGREPSTPPGVEPRTTPRASGLLLETNYGQAMGTPRYMAPEQARGETHEIGPQADVYALGAILHEVLTGQPPRTPELRVSTRPLPLFEGHDATRRPLPVELVGLCTACLKAQVTARPPDAGVVAREIAAWLDGAHHAEAARALVEEAERLRQQAALLRADEQRLREAAERALEQLPASAPTADKHAAWAGQDAAEAKRIEARLVETETVQRLRAALTHDPTHHEARLALARHHQQALLEAERRSDTAGAAEHEALLKTHDPGVFTAWLRGEWTLDLDTDPPGAEVMLARFEPQHRRLVPMPVRSLGTSPIRNVVLPQGSYVLTLLHPHCHPVTFPVYTDREHRFTAVPPGGSAPRAVYLPRLGTLGPDDCFVPAGWFIAGGDPEAAEALPRTPMWIDDFVIRRYPVTNAEYVAFLNERLERGEAVAHLEPRTTASNAATSVPTLAREGEGGQYSLGQGALAPRCAVTGVTWSAAREYAQSVRFAAGAQGRLPGEFEWEKASRGVDGRCWPWGNSFESEWAMTAAKHADSGLEAVERVPDDVSVYGVRHTAGNVRNWCDDIWQTAQAVLRVEQESGRHDRSLRGGAYMASTAFCRPSVRYAMNPERAFNIIGVRVGASFDLARV